MRIAISAALMLAAARLAAQTTQTTTATTGQVLGYVDADSVKRAAVGSVSEMLTARIPGVETYTRDGQVGVGSVAYVRGLSGATSFSEPLLIIDGVRADGRSAAFGTGIFGAAPGTSRLNDIDPSEIARVEVLTGPSAALYGPGSANGVILITTKQSQGGRPRIDLSAEGGLTMTPLRDADSYYAWGNGVQCLTYQRAAGQCSVDSITQFNPLLAPQSAVTQDGYLQRYTATVGGGLVGNAFRYMVAGNYGDEMGTLGLPVAEQAYYQTEYHANAPPAVVRPNAMDQGGVRGTVAGNLGSVADLSATLGFLGNHQRSANDDALLGSAAITPGYQVGDGWYGTLQHPADIFAARSGDNVQRLTGSVHGELHPLPALRAFVTAGIDQVDETRTSDYEEAPAVYPIIDQANEREKTARGDVTGGITVGGAIAEGLTSKLTVGGEYSEDHFTSNAVALTSYEGGTFFGESVERWARTQIGSGYVEDAVSVGDRVFVSGGVRVDDVRLHPILSTTATNGFVKAAWLPLPTTVPGLRVHGGYSTSSQAPTAEQAVENVLTPLVGCISYSLGGYCAPDFELPKLPREQDVEFGVSATAWRGRVTADVTVYDRRTARVFLPIAIDSSTAEGNLGVVRNRGIEGQVSARVIDRADIGWDATLTASGNQNRLFGYGFGVPYLINGLGLRSGYPEFGLWGYPYTYTSTNGGVAPGQMTFSTTPTFFGSTVPTRQASLGTSVRLFHRWLRVATLVDYRGGYVLPDIEADYRALGQYDPAENNVPASLGRQAQAMAAYDAPFAANSFYQHVEAVRWRELSATVSVQRFDITLAARNLALWTTYKGNDPDWDITANNGAYAQSLRLPPPQTFLIKVATTL